MLEPGKIAVRQLATLVFLAIIGDMIIILPPIATGYTGQDGWIVSLLSIPFGLALVWMMMMLAGYYPKLNLIQINEQLLGKWLGPVISLLYILFFLIASSIYIREVGDFLTTQLFVNTPIRYIHLLLIIALLWAIWHGLECIARTAEILVPLFVFIYFVLVICLIPEMDITRLMPILQNDMLSMVKGTLLTTVYPFGEMCVFLMIFPYVNQQSHIKRDVLLVGLIAGLMLAMIVFVSLTVMGSFFTQHNIYATYILTQKINIGGFLQRIEALMAVAWVLTTFIKSCLFFYAFVLGTAQLFKLNTMKPLYVPTSFLLFGLSLLVATDINYYLKTIVPYWIDWDLTYSLVFPLLLLAVHWFRNRQRSSLPAA